MINVFLAEDHHLVRSGISMLLQHDAQFKIVGEASSGQGALAQLQAGLKADVLLADLHMCGMDGMLLARQVKQVAPQLAVVILSAHHDEQYVLQAFDTGISAYLLKNIDVAELVFALKYVASGRRYLCAELAMKMLDGLPRYNERQKQANADTIDFSLREIEVLKLIAQGFTNSEMAEKLFISKRTVEGHRQNLIDKTDSKNTAALIRFAVLNGIVS